MKSGEDVRREERATVWWAGKWECGRGGVSVAEKLADEKCVGGMEGMRMGKPEGWGRAARLRRGWGRERSGIVGNG